MSRFVTADKIESVTAHEVINKNVIITTITAEELVRLGNAPSEK